MRQVTLYTQHDWVDPAAVTGQWAVVIDTFRATTTITAALQNGCLKVLPVMHTPDGLALKQQLLTKDPGIPVLLGGERHTQIIPGYDCGNSPLEYTPAVVGGKVLVLSTTNGTKAALKAVRAGRVFLACLNNCTAVAQKLLGGSADISFICAGTRGKFSLEDVITAGGVLHALSRMGGRFHPDDAAYMAQKMFAAYSADIDALLCQTAHYNTMRSHGLTGDLAYCQQIDSTAAVPVYSGGAIRLAADT